MRRWKKDDAETATTSVDSGGIQKGHILKRIITPLFLYGFLKDKCVMDDGEAQAIHGKNVGFQKTNQQEMKENDQSRQPSKPLNIGVQRKSC